MSTTETTVNEVGVDFVDEAQLAEVVEAEFIGKYQTVRDHIQQEIIRQHLLEYLPGEETEVLAVGGEIGDALWLVGQGHRVTVAAPSEDVLRINQNILKGVPAAIRQKISLLEGDGQILKASRDGRFDVVLSHSLSRQQLYIPPAYLGYLTYLSRPGGLMSVLAKGHVRGDRYQNHPGTGDIGYRTDLMQGTLRDSGAVMIAWYGISTPPEYDRDHRGVNDIDPQTLRRVVEAEKSSVHAATKPYETLHYLAVKPEPAT